MDYDIIIVGAGPAGLSTGLHLAQSSPKLAERTLILERERHPRPKLCAGGVLPGAEVCLRKLGLDTSEIPSVPVREIRMQFEDRGVVVRHRPVCFRVVQREQFDAWLADAARERELAIQEGARVLGVRPLGGRVAVETDRGSYYARAVVGADGSMGVVRRAVVRERIPQLARALEIQLPAALPAQNARATFDFSWIADGVQGYVWDFPAQVEGRPMRTWGVYDSRVYPQMPHAPLKQALEQGLTHWGAPTSSYKLEGHPVRWFNRRAAFAAPRILLAGDAAGSDPAVGEGISFALGYGEVAAGALRDAFTGDDFSFADYRGRVMAHRIGRYLRRRVVGARLLYGLRNRRLLCSLWPLLVRAADRFFIDWDWGEKEQSNS